MSRPGGTEPLGAQATPHDVEVRVPTTRDAAATVRTVAADLAARAEFTLDAVADLRLAVDEVSATLADLAESGTRLTCSFSVEAEEITVTVSVSTTYRTEPLTTTFGWRILCTLTDDLRVLGEVPGTPGSARRVAVRFSVPRTATDTVAADHA